MWNALEENFDGRVDINAVVLGGNQSPQSAQARAEDLGSDIETLFDPELTTFKTWGLSGEPQILLLDAQGRVIQYYDWVRMISVVRDRSVPGDMEEVRSVVYAKLAGDLESALSEPQQ
ncbi:MAG: hypothetical protein ACI87O_001759 [Planctomycetota bacterium]